MNGCAYVFMCTCMSACCTAQRRTPAGKHKSKVIQTLRTLQMTCRSPHAPQCVSRYANSVSWTYASGLSLQITQGAMQQVADPEGWCSACFGYAIPARPSTLHPLKQAYSKQSTYQHANLSLLVCPDADHAYMEMPHARALEHQPIVSSTLAQ